MVAGAGIAMGAGILTAVKAAGEFERKLDYFTAVGGPDAAKNYDAVREKALQLGQDTIYSADQIADSFVELAKSGVGAQDIIDGIGEGVAALGAAADIPLDTAANIITSAVATFNLGADQAVDVANKLAGAANASIVDVQDLGVSLKYAGGVASALKVPFSDVNTALAILGVNGIKGSTAGTSLRQILLGLNGSTKKAKDALKELGIITADGANKFYDSEGRAKSLSEIFEILGDATKDMSDQQRVATYQQIFATRALPSLIALTKAGADGFEEMYAEISKTTALAVSSERLDNLSGDIEILRGNIDTLLIESGSGFQTFARGIVQGITAMVQAFTDLPAAVQQTILIFIAVSAALLTFIGFAGIISGSILNIIGLAIRIGDAMGGLRALMSPLTKAFLGFFAILRANPIVLIITAIAALIGLLYWFFTQTETGQGIWAQFMALIQQAAPIVMGFFSQLASILMGLLVPALQIIMPILQAVGQFFMAILAPLLPIITTALQGVGEAFSGIGTNAQGLEGIVDIVSQVFNGLITAIPIIITALVQLVTTLITTLVGMVPTLVSGAITLFTSLIIALITILPILIDAALNLIVQVITALVGMIPQLVQGALTLFQGVLTAIVIALPLIVNGILQLVVAIVGALVGAIPILIEAAIQLFTTLVDAIPVIIPLLLDSAVSIFTALIGAVIEAVPLLLDAAITLFTSLLEALVEIIPMIITTVIELIPTIIVALISLIPILLDAAIKLFMALVEALPKILPRLIDAVINLIPKLIGALLGLIPKLLEAAFKLFMAIVQAIPKIIPPLVKALVDLGTQIIRGLINGIKGMADAVINAIGGVVGGAIDWAKGLLGIHSPSRVFEDIGVDTITGLIDGLAGEQRALDNQMATMVDSMTDFYSQVDAAREMDLAMSLGTSAANTSVGLNASATAQLSAMNATLAEIAAKDTFNIEELNVNNPEPETTSKALPDAIRDTEFLLSGAS